MLIELKSRFDGDFRLPQRAAAVLASYSGPAALMSFDPQLVAFLRHKAPHLTRGIVAERHYVHHEWDALPRWQKRRMAFLLHAPRTRPDFVAYAVRDLPGLASFVARTVCGLPLLTWTVRSEEDRARAHAYADQMIFEGFRP